MKGTELMTELQHDAADNGDSLILITNIWSEVNKRKEELTKCDRADAVLIS